MSRLMSSRVQMFRKVLSVVTRRFVSTTKKNNDTVSAEVCKSAKTTPKSTSNTAVKEQNWISYGFEVNSKSADRNAMHSIMFASVTLCMVLGGYYWAYMPDYTLRDWTQREAFIELRRREENNLPLVDPNFIDISKITLPSDEELEGFEIIV